MVATLRREADEESQVDVAETVQLGFEEMTTPGTEPVALIRLAGRIARFNPRRPDVDGGQLLRRHMVRLSSAPALLGWGNAGTAQAVAAAKVATSSWSLPIQSPTAEDAEIP